MEEAKEGSERGEPRVRVEDWRPSETLAAKGRWVEDPCTVLCNLLGGSAAGNWLPIGCGSPKVVLAIASLVHFYDA